MASIIGRIVSTVVRATGNVNPETLEKNKADLIKNLRAMENTFKHYIPPIGYKLERHEADGLEIEFFKKKKGGNDKLIFVMHGGAYITRMAFIYRWLNRFYSRASGGGSVLHFDYRCNPEHKYPCALEDAEKAWDWALEHGFKPENIVTVGDSAGGNLSMALLLTLRRKNMAMPAASVFASPWLDMTLSGKSYKENFPVDPVFGLKGRAATDKDIDKLRNSRLYTWFGEEDRKNPFISHVYAELDSSFPPAYITAGGSEVLLSDAVTLNEKLKAAGVYTEFYIAPGMYHDYYLYRFVPEAVKAETAVYKFIGKMLGVKK